MTNSELICTLWVCQCCMLSHANGECCPDDAHGGDGVEPWSKLDQGEHVTMGLLRGEHAHDCGEHCEQSCQCNNGACDCEYNCHSMFQCGGCGSYLHGERHAFTLWRRTGVSLVKAS